MTIHHPRILDIAEVSFLMATLLLREPAPGNQPLIAYSNSLLLISLTVRQTLCTYQSLSAN